MYSSWEQGPRRKLFVIAWTASRISATRSRVSSSYPIRRHFVDEVLVTAACERGIVQAVLDNARAHGIGLRVVPNIYYLLARNQPIEYIGHFATIPLHLCHGPEKEMMFKRSPETANDIWQFSHWNLTAKYQVAMQTRPTLLRVIEIASLERIALVPQCPSGAAAFHGLGVMKKQFSLRHLQDLHWLSFNALRPLRDDTSCHSPLDETNTYRWCRR